MMRPFIPAVAGVVVLSFGAFAQDFAPPARPVSLTPPPIANSNNYNLGNELPSDPSRLTTQQLDRAIVNLRAEIYTRLDAIDKAQELFHADFVRVPTQVDREINHLRELIEDKITKLEGVASERFVRIDNQFQERDKRTESLQTANSTAIAAALQAQKEAVGEQNKSSAAAIAKSESSTAEAITQLRILMQSDNKSITDQIVDLKSRLDKGEGSSKGSGDTWAMIALFVSIGTALITVIILVFRRDTAPPVRRS